MLQVLQIMTENLSNLEIYVPDRQFNKKGQRERDLLKMKITNY